MAARDILFITVMVAVLGLALFIVYYMLETTVDKITDVETVYSSQKTNQTFQNVESIKLRFDYVIFSFFMASILGLIITGWLVSGYPIMMFVYFIVIVASTIISSLMANFWKTATTVTIFGTTVNNFPITNHIVLNLPIYATVVGFIGIVVMFAKPYVQQ